MINLEEIERWKQYLASSETDETVSKNDEAVDGTVGSVDGIKVFVKINAKNEIIEINSSVFIKNLDDYIEINNGFGDKFVHAQSNYLTKSLTDKYGRFNFKWENGEIVEVTHGEFNNQTTEEILIENAIDMDFRLSMLEMGI